MGRSNLFPVLLQRDIQSKGIKLGGVCVFGANETKNKLIDILCPSVRPFTSINHFSRMKNNKIHNLFFRSKRTDLWTWRSSTILFLFWQNIFLLL